jgi:hypothetical protein
MHESLTKALEESRRDSENAMQGEEERKTLAKRLSQYREEAQRSAIPVDGDEPPEKRGLTK